MNENTINKSLLTAALASLLAGGQAYADHHEKKTDDHSKHECKADDKSCTSKSSDHSCKEHKCQAGKCMEGKCSGYVPKDKKAKMTKEVAKPAASAPTDANAEQGKDVKK